MDLVRRSLGEDDVDRHNHACAAPFFLLLSLVTWLLPLSPHLQLQTPEVQPSVSVPVYVPASASGTPVMPRFKADCWCPAHLAASQVTYTNEVCAGAFNSAVRGENSTGGVGVYQVMEGTIPVDSSDNKHLLFNPNIRRQKYTPKEKEIVKRWQSKWEDIRRFSHVTTPWAFFFLGLALRVPYIVIRIFTAALGGVNVYQTLESAESIKSTVDAGGLDLDSRREAIHTLLWLSKINGSASASAMLYMLLKLLVCVAVVAGLVTAHNSLLPRAKEVGQYCTAATDMSSVAQLTDSPARDKIETYDTPESLSGSILLCGLSIRQTSDVVHDTIQCIFSLEEPLTIDASVTSPVIEPSSSEITSTPPQTCQLYESVFLVGQTYLVVLVVANVVSLFFWLTRLLCRVTGGHALSMDGALLYYMAADNCSPEIVAAMNNGKKGFRPAPDPKLHCQNERRQDLREEEETQ